MKKEYEISQLSDTCYIGLHNDILPFHGKLNKRLKAVAYDNEAFEIFYYTVELFENIDKKANKDFKIHKWTSEIRDKLTQLVLYQNDFINKVIEFNSELKKTDDNKFYFKDKYSIFITESEAIILKTASILDIAIQIYSRLSKNYINSFGKWIAKDDKKKYIHDIDKLLQDQTITYETLLLNHKINNKIKHHESLKLYPVENSGSWFICLTGAACDSKLLLVDKYLKTVNDELIDFFITLNNRINEKF